MSQRRLSWGGYPEADRRESPTPCRKPGCLFFSRSNSPPENQHQEINVFSGAIPSPAILHDHLRSQSEMPTDALLAHTEYPGHLQHTHLAFHHQNQNATCERLHLSDRPFDPHIPRLMRVRTLGSIGPSASLQKALDTPSADCIWNPVAHSRHEPHQTFTHDMMMRHLRPLPSGFQQAFRPPLSHPLPSLPLKCRPRSSVIKTMITPLPKRLRELLTRRRTCTDMRQRSQPEGPGSAQPSPVGAAARRSGKSAVPAQRAAAHPFPSHPSFPKTSQSPFFRVALFHQSGTLGSLPLKARKWGVETPWKPARSQFHWGRVACAHVQPATVKAHAPAVSTGFEHPALAVAPRGHRCDNEPEQKRGSPARSYQAK
ncbi:hypothetical protein SAMN05518849_11233 [Sphingobium sp. AP50]|nr:hypothetical protein SAMN05518849_11233 [Sphingobium sp. AP50]